MAELTSVNERQKAPDRHQPASLAPSVDFAGPIGISIADDVDDEAVYGKNRHRYKSRGR